MNADTEEQEDELLALESIFDSEEFVRDESKFAGEIRVCVELPADFTVSLKEGETLRQYEMSFLPPLRLTFDLPEDYPSSSPPSFTLTCSWLTDTQLSALRAQLTDLYQATGGAVVLFTWVQFLKEDALRFLGIHTLLELPSDEHSTHDSLNAALSEPNNNQHPPKSGEPEVSAPSLEAEHPIVSSTESEGAVSLDSSAKDVLNEESASSSLLPPSSSSDSLDTSGQSGAASLQIHPRGSPQHEHQTPCGLSLTPSQTLLSQLLIYDAAQKQKDFATTVFDCGVCFTGLLGSDCVQLPECGHIFCRACLAEFCKHQITEGNVRGVACPEADCAATPTPAQVKSLVGEELFSRYDRLLLQITLDCMPDVVYCPRRSCASAVIRDKSSTAAMCSVCSFAFCVTCRKTYHGTGDCFGEKTTNKEKTDGVTEQGLGLPQSEEGLKALWDDYTSGSKQRKQLLESRYGRRRLLFTMQEGLSENWITHNSKNCPHCFCRIQKVSGCNTMMCSQCRQRFCWACLTRLPSARSGSHFADNPDCSLYDYY